MLFRNAASEVMHLLRTQVAEFVSQRFGPKQLNTRAQALDPQRIQWVFLGPPGVGKGTYSTRVAVALGVAHIAAGDLVRGEIRKRTPLGQQARCAPQMRMHQSSPADIISIRCVVLYVLLAAPCFCGLG